MLGAQQLSWVGDDHAPWRRVGGPGARGSREERDLGHVGAQSPRRGCGRRREAREDDERVRHCDQQLFHGDASVVLETETGVRQDLFYWERGPFAWSVLVL